jgi:hypothetical protein
MLLALQAKEAGLARTGVDEGSASCLVFEFHLGLGCIGIRHDRQSLRATEEVAALVGVLVGSQACTPCLIVVILTSR